MKENTLKKWDDELEEEISIDVKKILLILWDRKKLILTIFVSFLIFFLLLYFISPKKYKTEASIYIDEDTSSNFAEFNPFAISEQDSTLLSTGVESRMLNSMEFIKSPIVIDKVIKELNMVYPSGKKKGLLMNAQAITKKNLKMEVIKGTYILSLTYKAKSPQEAYDVLNSIIKNYTEVLKNINVYKSQSDIKILEQQYNDAKKELSEMINDSSELPQNMLGNTNLYAISGFSSTANLAVSNIKKQYISGLQSTAKIEEQQKKIDDLSKKLELAKLIIHMADATNVIVLKSPELLEDYEFSSPKLILNILFALMLAGVTSIIAVLFKEFTDKKLTYSMLGDNIIYNLPDALAELKTIAYAKQNEKFAYVYFDEINKKEELDFANNVALLKAEISQEFSTKIHDIDFVVLFVNVHNIDSELYKNTKLMLNNMNKTILKEVVVNAAF